MRIRHAAAGQRRNDTELETPPLWLPRDYIGLNWTKYDFELPERGASSGMLGGLPDAQGTTRQRPLTKPQEAREWKTKLDPRQLVEAL